MAKKSSESGVYRVTEIIGTSTVSWEAAAKNAVDAAAKSLRDLRVAEISKLDMKIEAARWSPTARASSCRLNTAPDPHSAIRGLR